MKEKTMFLIGMIVSLIIVWLCVMYNVDMNRMKNNKPVIFSTWGYDYTAPVTPQNEVDKK